MRVSEVVRLVTYIAEQSVEPDTELFESGILDSLALIDLITELEYDIELFDRQTWSTCRKIAEVLTQWTSLL